MTEATDSTALLSAYETKISDAIERLGPPEKGNVWLYRVEHLRDIPTDKINTEHYTPEQIATLEDARGRWFGDDLAVRFQHMHRYVQTESHENVENIRLSAVQVPLAVAATCHLATIEHPDVAWEEMTPLQRGRSTTSTPDGEYFFPKKLTAADVGDDKAAVPQAAAYNRVLADLEAHKQPLCEIPLTDYLKASPEAWYEMGQHLDEQHGTSQTRDAVNFYSPSQSVADRLAR